MRNKVWTLMILGLAFCLVGLTPVMADDLDKNRQLEEAGIDPASAQQPRAFKVAPQNTLARAGGVLLIPDSTADVVGMYDPYDGTYLGDLINGSGLFSTPINAILGPDGNIYVSDQVADSVFVYDTAGNYLSTYADGTDGLNNVRGIDFYNGHLFVTSGDDYVAEFSGPHTRLADFINDGSDPFDVHFLPNGEALLCDIGNDQMAHYKADGTLNAWLFACDFPEQVQDDSVLPGEFLVNSFSDKQAIDFELNGTQHQITPHGMSGRGIYRLGNGNLLVTSGAGVEEIDPVTGAVIQTENTGSARFIEYLNLSSLFIDTDTISATTGGVVNFDLDAGAANANRFYLLFGGVSGTTPGTTLPGGVNLPINWDVFTNLGLALLNTAPFSGFMGQLDANGQAQAKFDTLGPISASGFAFDFAFALNNPWDYASNAVTVNVIP